MNVPVVNVPVNKLVLVLATLIGAWGGFPSPPGVFIRAAQNPLVQWALVVVLAWQGGAGQDIKLSLLGTAILFALTQVLNNVVG